ncbi:MAG TPA: bifunctional diguanylate cyclase/phosphodiesterase [Pyrinomonadaceae bacterium]|jgi:diguanylate cyclase (GGDEF)-like protein
MHRETFRNNLKLSITLVGMSCLGLGVVLLPSHALNWGFALLVVLVIAVIPRMSLAIPRSNAVVSFSDALVFLSFLLYGPAAAIVLAGAETLANCYYNKWTGKIKFAKYMIATNVSIGAISTAFTVSVWFVLTRAIGVNIDPASVKSVISTLGVFAFTQFFAVTLFAAIFHSLERGLSLWEAWKKDCFSSSMTQVVGAGVAGTIYEIINFGDLTTMAVAFAVFLVVYFTYRQSIAEINLAIIKVEQAERETAETERTRRVEVEHHASQLSESLEQQNQVNAALRKSRRDFKHAALHDSLTGLANRKHLRDLLRVLIEQYRDEPTQNFHVLFIDLQRFKNINDSLGHTIGDKVLMIAAKRFIRMVAPTDTVARLGGDEFAIILRNLSTVGKAQKVARRIAQSIAQPFSLSGNRISVDVNIGIAPCDAEYTTPEEILRDADIAMHFAKERETGVAVFTKELRDRFLERAGLELDLRHAIERDEMSMHYQPIVSLSDGHLIGFEALLRWHHREAGMIPPVKFIPIAEESGLIQPMTAWILQVTCKQMAKWRQVSRTSGDLIVSVNISGKHLSTDDLIDDVELALDISSLPASSLKLEVTESTAMENAEHTINILNRLKQIGVKLSIDDFGTGYSSLSYLHRLPFDTLKIDRSFVSRVGENGENSEVLQTIISLAKNLKMRVIAEGIETESQLNVLKNLGCDFGQGYLLAKPQTRENAERMLYENPNFLPADIHRHYESQTDEVETSLPVF